MKKEMFKPFQGSFVKIVLKKNDFILYGVIDQLFEDGMLFKTHQKSSIISYDLIVSVIPTEEKYRRSHER